MESLSARFWKVLNDLPGVDQMAIELIDEAFAPRLVAKQIACIVALQTLVMTSRAVWSGFRVLRARIAGRETARRLLQERMKASLTYEEWLKFATELDELDGHNVWRQDDDSILFNSRALRRRTTELRAMLKSKDKFHLIFRLRSGLARDKYGILSPSLFKVSRVGTKKVIVDYHAAVCDALNFICDGKADGEADGEGIPYDVLLAFFNETRHSYGRTALLLSGGASLGFYHIGLAKCLYEHGLLPRVISGASAGSLMAAMLGTRNAEEILQLINDGTFRKDFFRSTSEKDWKKQQPEGAPDISSLQYLLPSGLRWLGDKVFGFMFDRRRMLEMDTEHLRSVVIDNVGTSTFQEAFDHTGRIINIIVAPTNSYDPPRLLNYLTAPHVCIWSAVVASCAIPGVFDSTPLVVKEPTGNYRLELETEYFGTTDIDQDSKNRRESEDEQYSDGSIERDLPMQQLSELFNVNHFIVNPHSFLLSSFAINVEDEMGTPVIFGALVGYLRFLKAQCRDWLRNIIDLAAYRSVDTRRGFSQMLTQEYEGRNSDVNILPWRGDLSAISALLSLIRNPTPEEYKRMVQVSQRNTWPHLAKIKAHCSVEMTLDQCVQRLRRLVSLENRELHLKLDRTPSFHTTRSLVNLGGLGVVDPTPLQQQDGDEQAPLGITKTTSMASFYYSRDKSSNDSFGSSSPKGSNSALSGK